MAVARVESVNVPVRTPGCPSNPRRTPRVGTLIGVSPTRFGVLLFVLLWSMIAPTLAESPAEKQAPARQSARDPVAAVEAELAEARQKLAAGLPGSLASRRAAGAATQDERDEWKLLLSLRISGLERHLDALRKLDFEVQSHQELKARVQAWSGFAQPPPYSIDFIDALWGDLIAGQQDIEAAQIARNLVTTQVGLLRDDLDRLQTKARQADERARTSARAVTPEQARLDWLSELARERVLTTLARLAQYEAMLRSIDEALARLQLSESLLRRQIATATQSSPMTQAELDSKLTRNAAVRVALEQELAEIVKREPQGEALLQAARVDLQRRISEAEAGNGEARARIELAQAMLDTRTAQAETTMLHQEALSLLIDAERVAEQIWRARFELASKPGLGRLREMHGLLAEASQRIALWKQYLANSLEAAVGLAVAAEKGVAADGDEAARAIAEAKAETYRERKALFERLQAEINTIELLLMRWEQEVRLQDQQVSRAERFKALLDRLSGGAADLWNLEVFAVEDTIKVEGREVTGSSSITVGDIVTVLLILTLGLWIAGLASRRFSLVLSSRFDMTQTAAALLDRGLYIASIVALFLIVLDIVNIPLTVFAFLGGALAIGVGFGAQNLINNFISGLILLTERPISLDDLVEVEGVRGRVRTIGARCSRIRRADGIDMLVPNSVFLEKNVTNLTLTDTQLRVSVKVGVAYGSPLREVTRLLQEAVEMHGRVLKDPAPMILFDDFGDNALMFDVNFWVNVSAQTDSRVVASDLRYMIERLLREAGIAIAYPQRDVHLDQTRPLEVVVTSGGPASAIVASENSHPYPRS